MNPLNRFPISQSHKSSFSSVFVCLVMVLFFSCSLVGVDVDGKTNSENTSLISAGLLLQTLSQQSTYNTPPTVRSMTTYSVSKTTHVYAQALSHSNWGSATTNIVNLSLDLYLPENAPRNRPAMILIHGGGFSTGSKDDTNIVSMANYFTSRGWVCISINYRLISAYGTLSTAWGTYVLNNAALTPAERQQSYAMYPAARDAKAALRWLYANASTYGINTNYMTALGGSAGSFLANMLGITNVNDFRDETLTLVDTTLLSTNLNAGSTIHTVIDHWGGITHMTYLQTITGQSRFDANDPPISIVHGTLDADVPFSQAEALRDAYIATGASYEFNPLVGEGHSAWSATINGKSLSENAFQFIVTKQTLTVN
ncbi:Esterase/lipase [Leptospira biflexa serovar Patoc strain 'Patoc 1 (Ames)']|uniref:alpha/beta hydrolase n=1 Tax=Leptospira biflexa TaxID=172 RepID=UPI000165A423|nr:alpha/beta hydrolase [Leptospira biflexa]ABZ92942.1 Esterase/lipase [Leptospira biflexa serovar Patoc strain 'Patoc 1 (Ames)']